MAESICALIQADRDAIVAAVHKAERAAIGDSNDAEIGALRDAVDECLRVLGLEIPDDTTPHCDDCGVTDEEADSWCGNCGSCYDHCTEQEGC